MQASLVSSRFRISWKFKTHLFSLSSVSLWQSKCKHEIFWEMESCSRFEPIPCLWVRTNEKQTCLWNADLEVIISAPEQLLSVSDNDRNFRQGFAIRNFFDRQWSKLSLEWIKLHNRFTETYFLLIQISNHTYGARSLSQSDQAIYSSRNIGTHRLSTLHSIAVRLSP